MLGDVYLLFEPVSGGFMQKFGEKTRYAVGTKASFAVNLIISRKLDIRSALALHIEVVKEGEEPINFGSRAVLIIC